MSRPLDRILAVLGSALVLATGAVALVSDKAASNEGSASASQRAGSVKKADRIEITDFKYKPPAVQVKVGSTVTFVNNDRAEHTGTSKASGVFDTGSIKQGETRTVVLKKAGSFNYYCSFHPFMKAKIQVVN